MGELVLADGELAAGVVELGAWAADGELVALVAAELTVPDAETDADAETVADGVVVARAVPVTPLVMAKRPVARPTVTGRECADRMRTPCLLAIAAGKRTRRNVVSIWWFEMPFGCASFYSTPIPAPDATPASPVTSHRLCLVAQRHIRSCRPGWSYQAQQSDGFSSPIGSPLCPSVRKKTARARFVRLGPRASPRRLPRRLSSSAGRRRTADLRPDRLGHLRPGPAGRDPPPATRSSASPGRAPKR